MDKSGNRKVKRGVQKKRGGPKKKGGVQKKKKKNCNMDECGNRRGSGPLPGPKSVTKPQGL